MGKKLSLRSKMGMGLSLSAFFFLALPFLVPVTMAAAEESPSGVVYEVVPSAKIAKVIYYLDDFKGRETVVFEVGVKNVSNQPKRFKLIVSIADGPSAAYYYPLAGNPPELKPGEVHMQPLPMVFYDRLPCGFTIHVEEM